MSIIHLSTAPLHENRRKTHAMPPLTQHHQPSSPYVARVQLESVSAPSRRRRRRCCCCHPIVCIAVSLAVGLKVVGLTMFVIFLAASPGGGLSSSNDPLQVVGPALIGLGVAVLAICTVVGFCSKQSRRKRKEWTGNHKTDVVIAGSNPIIGSHGSKLLLTSGSNSVSNATLIEALHKPTHAGSWTFSCPISMISAGFYNSSAAAAAAAAAAAHDVTDGSSKSYLVCSEQNGVKMTARAQKAGSNTADQTRFVGEADLGPCWNNAPSTARKTVPACVNQSFVDEAAAAAAAHYGSLCSPLPRDEDLSALKARNLTGLTDRMTPSHVTCGSDQSFFRWHTYYWQQAPGTSYIYETEI